MSPWMGFLMHAFSRGAVPLPQARSFAIKANGSGGGRSERILIVDEEAVCRELLSSFLSACGYECRVAASGEAALRRMNGRHFALVISDVRRSNGKGFKLLDHLRAHYPAVPVITIAGDGRPGDGDDAMEHGAVDYIAKPFDLSQVVGSVCKALGIRSARIRDQRLSHTLKELVQSKSVAPISGLRALPGRNGMTLEALMRPLDAREGAANSHSVRVRSYAVRLAWECGIAGDEMEGIACGALLHDIGKIGISDSILLKPGKLTEAEWVEVRKHPRLGHEMLKEVGFTNVATLLVLGHHERWDGSGYPDRLSGGKIPMGARLVAVVDTLEAMTSNRSYRKALTYEHARREIERLSGVHYDPQFAGAFLGIPKNEWEEIRRFCSVLPHLTRSRQRGVRRDPATLPGVQGG